MDNGKSTFSAFKFKWATNDWEHQQAKQLRIAVFCDEQQLFDCDDHDEKDDSAVTLVALSTVAGNTDIVVGTVRIYQYDNNCWQGSRLAVRKSFRGHRKIGAGLIKLAVSSAHRLGCAYFRAVVQKANETFFKSLHWETIKYLEHQSQPHVMMKADLSYYPPCNDPEIGFYFSSKSRPKHTCRVSSLLPNAANLSKTKKLISEQKTLQEIITVQQQFVGLKTKSDIQLIAPLLAEGFPSDYPNGDDTAVISNDNNANYQLFSIEGFQPEFVNKDPWFAGWCSVMVNLNDIAAMGGKPQAIVNAIWSPSAAASHIIFKGMTAASNHYEVPIVGGHTNLRSQQTYLATAILGNSMHVTSAFNGQPNQDILMVVDLRGSYREPFLNWNAATNAPAQRAREDLNLLAELSNQCVLSAAKDISQAGILGTCLMLLESSELGANVHLDSIPRPDQVDINKWIKSFPSFGFIITCRTEHSESILERFKTRNLDAAVIGRTNHTQKLTLHSGSEAADFWDLEKQPLLALNHAKKYHIPFNSEINVF